MKTPSDTVPKSEKQHRGLSDTQRWVICFTLLFISLFALVSIISYYFTWSKDQMGLRVVNNGGTIGYMIGDFLVGDWFGATALCIPLVVIILSLRIMRYRPAFLERSVRITLIVMILGSVSLGFFFGRAWDVFGSGLGGKMGIDVAEWLQVQIGKMGVGLLLFLSWILLAVYINRRTIHTVNTVARKTARLLVPKSRPADAEDESESADDDRTEPSETANVADVPPYPFIEVPQEGEAERSPRETDDADMPDDDIFVPADEPAAEIPSSATAMAEEGVEIFGAAAASSSVRRARTAPAAVSDGFEIIDQGGGMTGLPEASKTIGAGGIVEGDEDGGMQIIRHENTDAEAERIANLYDPTRELSSYHRPPVEILEKYDDDGVQFSPEEINENKNMIQQTLENFGIKINRIKATIGPTVTLYEIEPAQGVKVSRIKSLEDDIALSLKALSIRIIAPMPGKGTIGIEIPNRTRRTVSMYSVVRSVKFQDCKYELPVVLGKTIQNETFIIDLAKMPHLLVAGATGQGKSVGLNVIINSLIYKKHPAELKFVLVDPKKVELSLYAKIEKHFLAKMENEDNAILTDTQKVVYTLNSLCIEMQARYDLLGKAEVRKISEYNEKFLQRRLNPQKGHRYMPYIVVVVDEFADMIMTSGKEVETPITRLAQLARAVGIHLIIATQRPDVKVITGLIKANFPARIAFRVTSMVDSRTILDQPGANQLVGQGDMLMMINGELTRLQCAFIDTPEIERITQFIARQKSYPSAYLLPDYVPEENAASQGQREEVGSLDPLFDEIARFVVNNQQGSTSFIQRRFEIGYNRAGRIMDQLERVGIVGRSNGSKPREVLITDPASLERILNDVYIENL